MQKKRKYAEKKKICRKKRKYAGNSGDRYDSPAPAAYTGTDYRRMDCFVKRELSPLSSRLPERAVRHTDPVPQRIHSAVHQIVLQNRQRLRGSRPDYDLPDQFRHMEPKPSAHPVQVKRVILLDPPRRHMISRFHCEFIQYKRGDDQPALLLSRKGRMLECRRLNPRIIHITRLSAKDTNAP